MNRVLLIMPYGSVGGMERLALHFYNYYKTKGYDVKAVKFIKLQSDIINFNEDEFAFSTKDLSELSPLKRLWFYLSAPTKLKKIIKKNKITHSIAFGDMANMFLALSYTSEYKTGSIHALKSVELTNISAFSYITKWSYKTIYRRLNKVVCISDAIKTDLIEKCSYKFPENLETIYNPHDIKAIQSLAKDPIDNPFEKALFNTQTILFIGRLSNQKSPWHLINAFNTLVKNKNGINLIFLGDGDPLVTEHIKKLIDSYKIKSKVHFLGRKTNPYKYLKQADVLALSSHYEGTPNVIVESIALGIPVVSSNCTKGIMELMSLTTFNQTNDNIEVEAGVITPNLYKGKLGLPDNSDYLYEEEQMVIALKNVLNNNANYKNKIEKNKKELLKKFDLEFVTNEYLNMQKKNT